MPLIITLLGENNKTSASIAWSSGRHKGHAGCFHDSCWCPKHLERYASQKSGARHMTGTAQIVWGMLITPLVIHLISRKACTSCRPLFYALVSAALCVLLLVYLGLAGGISFRNATSNVTALAAFYAAYCLVTSALAAIEDPTPRIVMRLLFSIPLLLVVLASPIICNHIEGNRLIYSKAYENQMRCIVRKNDFFRDGSSYIYEANVYKPFWNISMLEESVPLVPPRFGLHSKSAEEACGEAMARIKSPH